MFNRKKEKIRKLEEELKTMRRMAYVRVGAGDNGILTLTLWSTQYDELKHDCEVLKGKNRDLISRNAELIQGLKEVRNKFAHYVLEADRLSNKIKGHKHELMETYDL
jgi:uncharacterized coiled-coil DUF342 family protein